MRIVVVAIALALLAGAVHAQNRQKEKSAHELQEERRQTERAEIEKQYDSTMRRLGSQNSGTTGPADPWRNIRPAGKSPNR